MILQNLIFILYPVTKISCLIVLIESKIYALRLNCSIVLQLTNQQLQQQRPQKNNKNKTTHTKQQHRKKSKATPRKITNAHKTTISKQNLNSKLRETRGEQEDKHTNGFDKYRAKYIFRSILG
jgi:hypothetical protein